MSSKNPEASLGTVSSQNLAVVSLMHKTMLVGHGDAVETGCQVAGLNNLADCKDSIVEELAIIGRPDHKIYRHGNAFIQFANKHGVEVSRRKHV